MYLFFDIFRLIEPSSFWATVRLASECRDGYWCRWLDWCFSWVFSCSFWCQGQLLVRALRFNTFVFWPTEGGWLLHLLLFEACYHRWDVLYPFWRIWRILILFFYRLWVNLYRDGSRWGRGLLWLSFLGFVVFRIRFPFCWAVFRCLYLLCCIG